MHKDDKRALLEVEEFATSVRKNYKTDWRNDAVCMSSDQWRFVSTCYGATVPNKIE